MRNRTFVGILFRAALGMWMAAALPAHGEPASCSLKRVASLDAITDRGQLLINVALNGRESWVRVDTGSPFNLINKKLADELKLRPFDVRAGAAYDAAGNPFRHFVKVETLSLGGMKAENVAFIVMGENGPDLSIGDGIFGANFLAAYDIELDLPHHKMNMFLQNTCDGDPVYWTHDYTEVRFRLDASLHVLVPITLDGQNLVALVDTGATASTLNARVAKHHFDLDPAADGARPDGHATTGTGTSLPMFRHRFGELDLGDVAFWNTELMILPDKVSRVIRDSNPIGEGTPQNLTFDAVLGLHHLDKVRVYIAYGQDTLYVSAADAH